MMTKVNIAIYENIDCKYQNLNKIIAFCRTSELLMHASVYDIFQPLFVLQLRVLRRSLGPMIEKL